MTSRVVHIRLPEDILIACYDMYEACNKSVENMPISTIVTSALIAAINSMRRDEIIPTYSLAELPLRVAELLPEKEELEIKRPRLKAEDFDSTFSTEEEVQAVPLDLTAHITAAPERIEQEGTPLKAAPLDLGDVDFLSEPDILQQAPKDRLAEMCESEDAWLALGIVYKVLPLDMWGSRQAERLFLKTLTELREAKL